MKFIYSIVLLLAAIACVNAQQYVGFNQNLSVNATSQTYIFGTIIAQPLSLTVSSSSATANSYATVQTIANLPIVLPSGAVSANGGLPAGYINLPLPTTLLGAGISVNFTADIDGNVNAMISFSPSILVSINASIYGNIRPLWFNSSTNAYYEVPSNQYNVSANGGITIYTSRSINLILAVRNPLPLVLSISNNAVITANIVANVAASFAINEGTRAALYIYNLTASAGTVSISLSANSNNARAAVSSSNILISNIYTFNHSAGNNANVNAQFSYDISQANGNYNGSVTANAAWYWWNNGAWVRQDSSVSGTVVFYNSNHFSDWSVQSGGSGGSGSSLEIPMFAKIWKMLF